MTVLNLFLAGGKNMKYIWYVTWLGLAEGEYDPIRSDISDFVADVGFFWTFFEIGKLS